MARLATSPALSNEDAVHIAYDLAVASTRRVRAEDLISHAETLRRQAPDADVAWCRAWASETTPNRATVADLLDAWAAEKARRVTVPIPRVAPEIENGPLWPAWFRAWQRALVAGADVAVATAEADAAVGAQRPTAPKVDPAAVAAARDLVAGIAARPSTVTAAQVGVR